MKRYLSIKKIFAMLLLLAMLPAVFAACATDEPMEPAGVVSDLSEEKHFDINDLLQNNDSSGEDPNSAESTNSSSQGTVVQPSGGELTGVIVASEKKYTYNGNHLMLLQVENETAVHLDITIKGKYLDKDGKVLKEESQTYHAFPSGWSNYFIFRPKMTFDSFDYTIEAKEFKASTTRDKLYAYNGEPLSKYAELTYSKNLIWDQDWNSTSFDLVFNYTLINRHPSIPIAVQFHILILDEQGNIYMTDYELLEDWFGDGAFSEASCDPIGGLNDGKSAFILKTQSEGEDRTIPSNVQGKLTAIFAIESVANR